MPEPSHCLLLNACGRNKLLYAAVIWPCFQIPGTQLTHLVQKPHLEEESLRDDKEKDAWVLWLYTPASLLLGASTQVAERKGQGPASQHSLPDNWLCHSG